MPAFSPDFNHNTHVIRRVRLDLPGILPSPYKEMLEKLPYAAWLKTHVAEVSALKNDKDEALLFSVRARTARGETGAIFVTDFTFASQAALEYYNRHYLASMRGRIEESYPGAMAQGSPFAYRIALDTEAEKFSGLVDSVTDFKNVA